MLRAAQRLQSITRSITPSQAATMATMRAVVFDKLGDSSVLQIKQIPKPSPKPGEVLVKIDYAGINFIDTYFRTGLYPTPLPAQTGRECGGVIEALGADVEPYLGLKVGDLVGAYHADTVAEYVAIPARKCLKLPPGVTTREAAAVIIQGLTAWTLVRDAHPVQPGEVVLVHAAAGGTGGLLVQMAKHLGATVIATASTPEKLEIAKSHGADHVINYARESVLDNVNRITDGKGCHAVLSGIGKATFDEDLECCRKRGTMITFGNASGAVEGFRPLVLGKKNIRLMRPRLDVYIEDHDDLVKRSGELWDLVAKGIVKVSYGNEYPIEEIAQAHDDLTSRKSVGKLLIKIA